MSIEVELDGKDYSHLMRWFELAFAKRNNIPKDDKETFSKISVMAMAYIAVQKEKQESE